MRGYGVTVRVTLRLRFEGRLRSYVTLRGSIRTRTYVTRRNLAVREKHSGGQSALLVRHRSGAARRWIEAEQASALGSVAALRCSGCGADRRRSVLSVGQPKAMKPAAGCRTLCR